MAATNDTIDGLLAEFRGYAAGMPDSYHVTMSWADFRKMLDRFDAAHKRELSKNASKNRADFGQLGDAAKLREALSEILSYIESFHKYIIPGKREKTTALFAVADTIRNNARAALAAPPRNCDVGVPEERIQRWSKFCKARSKKLPPIHGFEWEDYPYESEVKEGANDGNE